MFPDAVYGQTWKRLRRLSESCHQEGCHLHGWGRWICRNKMQMLLPQFRQQDKEHESTGGVVNHHKKALDAGDFVLCLQTVARGGRSEHVQCAWVEKAVPNHSAASQMGRTPGMLLALEGNQSLPVSVDSKAITKQVRLLSAVEACARGKPHFYCLKIYLCNSSDRSIGTAHFRHCLMCFSVTISVQGIKELVIAVVIHPC